ncbi:alpha/beta hydrolase [Ilumatobacter sp.]|uniref:alpha/beta hydrolase n=1 Tax=Ilumatobacter sp. TaxID=1967498 RepID=UPI003B52C1E2
MPLHAEARSLLALMEQIGAPPLDSLPPAQARAARRELAPPVLDPCHETVDLDAGGVPARLYRPEPGVDVPGLLVWYHGGGFVIGDLESHDNICHTLCRRSGHGVLSVDYRLAPEHPFPAGLDDCITATTWARDAAAELGFDPDRIAVGGDSAGGNLAAAVCHAAPIPIVHQMLIYPVTDARMGSASYEENAEGYFLTRSSMAWFVDHYLTGGAAEPDDPRVSVLLADDDALAAGPPALVITAGFDPLRDEGTAYAQRLAELGVATSHVHFPGHFHGFFSLGHMLADARAAHALAAQALADALAAPIAT